MRPWLTGKCMSIPSPQSLPPVPRPTPRSSRSPGLPPGAGQRVSTSFLFYPGNCTCISATLPLPLTPPPTGTTHPTVSLLCPAHKPLLSVCLPILQLKICTFWLPSPLHPPVATTSLFSVSMSSPERHQCAVAWSKTLNPCPGIEPGEAGWEAGILATRPDRARG